MFLHIYLQRWKKYANDLWCRLVPYRPPFPFRDPYQNMMWAQSYKTRSVVAMPHNDEEEAIALST